MITESEMKNILSKHEEFDNAELFNNLKEYLKQFEVIDENGISIEKLDVVDIIFHDIHSSHIEDYKIDNPYTKYLFNISDDVQAKLFKTYSNSNEGLTFYNTTYLDFYSLDNSPFMNLALIENNKAYIENKLIDNGNLLSEAVGKLLENTSNIKCANIEIKYNNKTISLEDFLKTWANSDRDLYDLKSVIERIPGEIEAKLIKENHKFSGGFNQMIKMYEEPTKELLVKLADIGDQENLHTVKTTTGLSGFST